MKILLILSFSILVSSCAIAQPTEWGDIQRGVQFGLEVKEDSLSYYYKVYVRCRGKVSGSFIYMNRKLKFSFFYTRYRRTYEVTPAKFKNISNPTNDEQLIRGMVYDRGLMLKCDEASLINAFVIQKKLHIHESPCRYWYDDIDPDTAYIQVQNFFPNEPQDSTIFTSNLVLLPYCQNERVKVEAKNNHARFLNKFINHHNGTPLEIASLIAQDTLETRLNRGIAGHVLAKMNSEESGQILYDICNNPKDKDLYHMLSHFFRTEDERYTEFIEKYKDHPNDTVQQEIVWAIGHFKSEKHLKLLLSYSTSEVNHTRRLATQSLKHFNNDDARKALYKRLEDTDFMIRSDAVYSLGEIGDRSSVKPLFQYVEREYPINVGYYQNAMRVIEKITGEQFNNDIERLRAYINN